MINPEILKENRVYFVGYTALILLPNHDLLNWFFSGTPLAIWKQLLAVVLSFFAISVLSASRSIQNGGTKHIRIMFFILSFATIVSVSQSLIQGLSLYRIVYAVLAYVGFFAASAFVVAMMVLGKTSQVLRTASILGVFCSIGLIFDYYTGWLYFLPRAGGIGIEEELFHGYFRRASFLFGASTTIFPFMSFCIISSVILYIMSNKENDKYYFIILIILVPIAVFFTGSRSQLILICLLIVLVLLIVFKEIVNMKSFVAVIIAVFMIPIIGSIISENTQQLPELIERYQTALESDQAGNDTRYQNWAKGRDLFRWTGLDTITGIGLGSSMGMVNDGRVSTSHYESSFFQAYSEAGYFGLILRYFPGILALFFLLNTSYEYNRRLSMIKKILIVWFLLYMASIFGSPTAGAYHTQFVYFMCVTFALKLHHISSTIK